MSTPREEWQQLLDPDERLLWVGTPAHGIRVTPQALSTSVIGLVVIGFSILFEIRAPLAVLEESSTAGLIKLVLFLIFVLFGLLFGAIGFYMMIGQYFHNAHLRDHMQYALTNRRALITCWAGERSLKSFPIGPETVIDYQPGPEATIYFATDIWTDSDGDEHRERVGFEHLRDGEKAYAVIRRIQNGTAG